MPPDGAPDTCCRRRRSLSLTSAESSRMRAGTRRRPPNVWRNGVGTSWALRQGVVRMMRSAFVAGVLLVLAVVWSPVAVLADDDVLIRGIPLSTLIEHLQGEDPVLGRAALAVLGAAAGPEAAAAVPALLDLLDADEAVDRGMAIGALGRIGPAANSAAGSLRRSPRGIPIR